MKKILFFFLLASLAVSGQDVVYVRLDSINAGGDVIVVNISGDNNLVNIYPPAAVTPIPPSSDALKLMFDDIANASLMIGGTATDVDDWNTFFGAEYMGTPFTSVAINNDTVELSGGDGITLRGGLFSNNDYYASIIGVVDEAGCLDSLEVYADGDAYYTPFYYFDGIETEQSCTGLVYFEAENITNAGGGCFSGCTSLTSTGSIITAGAGCFEGCTSLTSTGSIAVAGDNCFLNCTALVTIDLSECTNLGITTGNNSVFGGITGNTITVTCAAALLTCNEGAPDGDIMALTTNNSVIINSEGCIETYVPYSPNGNITDIVISSGCGVDFDEANSRFIWSYFSTTNYFTFFDNEVGYICSYTLGTWIIFED